nr:hypothetical protein [Tanacetum cinerariifolium]
SDEEKKSKPEETLRTFIEESHRKQKQNKRLFWRIKKNCDKVFKKQASSIKTIEGLLGRIVEKIHGRGVGSLTSFTETNPKGLTHAITTRSGLNYNPPKNPLEEIHDIQNKTTENISTKGGSPALEQVPKYAKFMKDLLMKRGRGNEASRITLNERCSVVVLNEIPLKEKDPGSFTIPCVIGKEGINKALADLGASISLMPYSMFQRLNLGLARIHISTTRAKEKQVKRKSRKLWMNEGDGKINTWEELVNTIFSKFYPLSCASSYDKMCEDNEEGLDPLEFITWRNSNFKDHKKVDEMTKRTLLHSWIEVGNNEGLMNEDISSDDDRNQTNSSMITKLKIKIGDEFLKILHDNSFNGMDESDVTDHIAKVLEITKWIKIPNVDKDELRLHVFSKSLSGDAEKWWNSEGTTTTWKELTDKFFHKYYLLSHTYKTGKSTQIPRGVAKNVIVKIDRFVFPVDFVVLDMKEDHKISIILGRPFLDTAHAMIDVFNKKISFEVGNETITFDIEKSMRFPPSDDDTCHSVDIIELSILNHVQEILSSEPFDSFLFEPINLNLPTKINSLWDDNEGEQDLINQISKNLKHKSEGYIKPTLFTANLFLAKHKGALAWKVTDIKVQDVVKAEIVKLFDAGLIYVISDNQWVSLIHEVPDKGGVTVVTKEDNEHVPTHTVKGWKVCIDYRKLNDATRKDYFSLLFIDQMLE